jgi:acyl-CoA synthetase (NDP forming)
MTADSRSLQALLGPASIAVVGASDSPHKVGGRPLQYLAQQGFRGRVYPVNPRAEFIQGLQAYPSIDALPEVPDAVILCVGSDAVEAQLNLCASLAVRAVVLFASGYAEVGALGLAEQQKLVDICRRGGMRLLGPNSIGVASFDTGAVLSFASIYADCAPLDGPVAIVSQSGAFGVSVYALLREAGIGVRCVAATGNEADLDTADFVAALAQSPGVRLILLYLENVGDAERMRAALLTARQHGVCVVAVRAGRSVDGCRSAGLHTGSAGAANDELDALFAGSGCRTVADMGEMLRCVPGYLRADGVQSPMASLPSSPRLAVVSNSGASCVIAADEASRAGITLAQLSPASQARLSELLPDFSLNRNPIDLTAMLLARPALLGEVMQCAMADPAVDCVVLGLLAIGGPSYDVARFSRDCRAATQASGKPLWVYSPHPRVRLAFSEQGLPVFAGEAEALREIAGHAEHLGALALPAIPNPEEDTLHA